MTNPFSLLSYIRPIVVCIAMLALHQPVVLAQKTKTSHFHIVVHDKVSNHQLNRVRIAVLSADSTLIDTCSVGYSGSRSGEREIFYSCQVKTAEPYYLLRFDREGYEQKIMRVHAAAEIELADVTMDRKLKLRNLNEAVVQATKIKMVMKGDTIVYNADAFELGEGSMLDQLISQLPGVKLERGGVITLNGNKVSSLLINGKDLFKGDVQKAMENLPAYIVSKVKAYQKAPDNAYLTRKIEKAEAADPWVIDVNLKKDYNQGWLVSAEGGYGTNSRYMGRLFALRFTNQTEMFLYGSTNNLNDKAKPWGQGNWYKDEVKNGQLKLQKGGAYFAYNSKSNKNRVSTSLDVARNASDIDNRTAHTSYYETGDTYSRQRDASHTRALDLNWTADGKYSQKKAFLSWHHFLQYTDNHMKRHVQNATFSRQPEEVRLAAVLDTLFSQLGYVSQSDAYLVSRYLNTGRSHLQRFDLREYLNLTLSQWFVFLGASYNHTAHKAFSQYHYSNAATSSMGDYRNSYSSAPQKSYDWHVRINRTLVNQEKGNWTNRLTASYLVDQAWSNTANAFYRLDKLGSGWELAVPQGKALGLLPSTADSLSLATDWNNSFKTIVTDWNHSFNVDYTLMRGRSFSLSFSPNLKYWHRAINDTRHQHEVRHVVRDYLWIEPALRIDLKPFKFSFSSYRQLPGATYLLDVCNDADPLFITRGNAHLKPSDTYAVGLRYSKFSRHTIAQAHVDYSHTRNAIGQARYYNSQTGVTTTAPANIDGNWQASWGGSLAHELDKKERWEVSLSADFAYLHSADFVQDGQAEAAFTDLPKSLVRNLLTTASSSLNYKSKPFNAGIKVSLDWQHAASHRVNFSSINSKDIFTTFNALAKLPWQVELSTDLTLYNRRGYTDRSMNTDEWIWNASLEKRVLRDKSLSFKCTAFDLLAQRRNVERRLNVQGYTETWYNTIPRYVLFTISYRFHKAPRRSYE